MRNLSSTPPRAELTQYLITILNPEMIVYAYDKPDNSSGGWNKEPGSPGSSFRPYSVITPLPAGDPQGSLADTGTEWVLSYSISTYGVLGLQTERQSDKIRKLWSETERGPVLLGTETWTVMKARCPRIGGIVTNRSGTKPIFEQNDTGEIHLSKGR